jgi:dTDP-glucose 4,6-dehydratase
MKLLITGGAGFIGAHFILYWLKNHPEDQVVNLDALTYAGHLENLDSVSQNPQYTFIKGDITDSEIVKVAMQGVDIVVHFAAESHVDRSVHGPAAFVHTNVVGTLTLLEAARDAKVQRFHHISTDEVFGTLELGSSEKFTESTPYNPRSPYSASKAGSDHLVRAFHDTYGLPVTISNCSNNYGPMQYPEKLIPVMILKALNDESLPIYGDGLNIRDWIHVEDHCRGIEAILQKGRVGETYCLGGNAERANIDVAKAILKSLDKPESLITFVQDRPGHDRRYAIDSTKAEQELGWTRNYTFESGLADTIAWYTSRADQLKLDEQGTHVKPSHGTN